MANKVSRAFEVKAMLDTAIKMAYISTKRGFLNVDFKNSFMLYILYPPVTIIKQQYNKLKTIL